nr:MAG TPA: hypothetical protein [Caudoviricetes sp.]
MNISKNLKALKTRAFKNSQFWHITLIVRLL